MTDSEKTVIVVGAGIAGLYAAYELKKKGIDSIVLEAASKVGGRMSTDSIDGYIIDKGAQFFSSTYRILYDLLEELGLKSSFVDTNKWIGIVRNGKLCKFRYDKPTTLLEGGLLSYKEALSLASGSLKLIEKTKHLPLNNYAAWCEYDDGSADIWSNEYFGESVTEYFFEPLLEAFYFISPEETSKALTIAFNAFSTHKSQAVAGGIGEVPEALAKHLNVKFSTLVKEVIINGNEVNVVTDTKNYKSSQVILATPAPISKKLYSDADGIENELLNIEYSTTVNIAIALKNNLPITEGGLENIYGVFIPEKERKMIAVFTIETEKHKDRAASGELVNVLLSRKSGKTLIDWGDEDISSAVLSELEEYLPNISNNIVFTKIYRWSNAVPMSPIGRSNKIKEYRETIKENKQVILAGDYLGMPFTEGAAESGAWAASKIMGNEYIYGKK